MSRTSESIAVLATLNYELQQAAGECDPLLVDVSGRPRFLVPSFDPLIYEAYSRRKRAPSLSGKFALIGFMWTQDRANDLVIPYSVVRTEPNLQYGVHASNQLVIDTGKYFDIELERTT